MENEKEILYFGIDGCTNGWICVQYFNKTGLADFYKKNIINKNGQIILQAFSSISDFWNKLLSMHHAKAQNLDDLLLKIRIFIDIPIGLPDSSNPVRKCDKYARAKLTRRRSSSIFPVPCRAAVYAENYEKANQINKKILNKGLSKQAWNISNKIKELDWFLKLNSKLINCFIESHPELCFWALNGGVPLKYYKKRSEGLRERINIIKNYVPSIEKLIEEFNFKQKYKKWKNKIKFQIDDLIDATILAISAFLSKTEYIRDFSARFSLDQNGLPKRIVHPPIQRINNNDSYI
ncbi:MAG: DUF429 domain-containing protein [Promethearchaeota archaeon]